MKLKELMTKIVKNKRNGQLITCIRKNKLRKLGISEKDLFDMKINTKFKELLED